MLEKYITVPRSTAIILVTASGFSLGTSVMEHEEAETRFVAVFTQYVQQMLGEEGKQDRTLNTAIVGVNSRSGEISLETRRMGCTYSCLILSDDTDVFVILLLSQAMRGWNFLHVLKDSLQFIDNATRMLLTASTTGETIATVYALAGCDFLPGTCGITHDFYVGSYLSNSKNVSNLGINRECEVYETVMCLAYLYKHGKKNVLSETEEDVLRRELLRKVNNGSLPRREMIEQLRKTFASSHAIGTTGWKQDGRNFVADRASHLCDLITPKPHIALQALMAKFIVHEYWGRSERNSLKGQEIVGCHPTNGYTVHELCSHL